jgi:hypothetical protein
MTNHTFPARIASTIGTVTFGSGIAYFQTGGVGPAQFVPVATHPAASSSRDGGLYVDMGDGRVLVTEGSLAALFAERGVRIFFEGERLFV